MAEKRRTEDLWCTPNCSAIRESELAYEQTNTNLSDFVTSFPGVEESREDLPVSSFAVLSRKTPEDAPTKKDDASDLSWNEICFKDHSQPDYILTERKIISWNHSGQFAESQGRGSAGFSFQDDAARQNSFQLRETRISNLLGKQNELLEDLKRMKGNSYRGA